MWQGMQTWKSLVFSARSSESRIFKGLGPAPCASQGCGKPRFSFSRAGGDLRHLQFLKIIRYNPVFLPFFFSENEPSKVYPLSLHRSPRFTRDWTVWGWLTCSYFSILVHCSVGIPSSNAVTCPINDLKSLIFCVIEHFSLPVGLRIVTPVFGASRWATHTN